jgi:hypothetical protein
MAMPTTICFGTTRSVVCIGKLAFKLARSRRGARRNRFEADLYKRSSQDRRALLCTPLWCSTYGSILVMRRAQPLTESEFAAWGGLRRAVRAWDYRGARDEEYPFKPKASDWGWLDGKPVAVDYSASMPD